MPERPRVLLNCAASLDGKIAAADGAPMRFSDERDWRRVQLLRASSDAILVGRNTVTLDDPTLKVDPEVAPTRPGRQLIRVVLDSHGRLPSKAKVLDGTAPTIVFVGTGAERRFGKAEVVTVPMDATGRVDLGAVLHELHQRGVRQLLVEGGGSVIRSFLSTDFVDLWTLYQAPVLVGGDGPSIWPGKPSLIGRRLHVENVEAQGKGVLWTFRP